jgi:hypothetical protein
LLSHGTGFHFEASQELHQIVQREQQGIDLRRARRRKIAGDLKAKHQKLTGH